jgi:hypothetical protein
VNAVWHARNRSCQKAQEDKVRQALTRRAGTCSEDDMSAVGDAQNRAIRIALKKARERDAEKALQEQEAQKEATAAKTARLRALRLGNPPGMGR